MCTGRFAAALVAYVRRIETAVLAGSPRERDELRGLGVRAGWIDERARQPECAVTHSLGYEALHLLKLIRCRLAIFDADDDSAHLHRAYVVRYVERHSIGLENAEVLSESAPAEGFAVDDRRLRLRRFVLRRMRPPFAAHVRRDALMEPAERRLAVAAVDERVVPHQIDEAGRDDSIFSVDRTLGGMRGGSGADRDDASVAHADAAAVPGIAAAIDNPRMRDQDIVRVRHVRSFRPKRARAACGS
jgi:hypothetical protein